MKNLFLILPIVLFLGNCRSDLTDQEIKWNPYKEGEILVFESSDNERDSIIISEITSSDSNEHELLEVKCKYFENSSGHPDNPDTVQSFLMALTAWKDNNSVLTINLNRKFALFAPYTAKRLTWLDSLELTSVESKNGTFNDVLILEPDTTSPDYPSYATDSLFVNKLYWSKSCGLIRFDLSNKKTSWSLVKRYSH